MQKELIGTTHREIVNDEIIFVPSEEANPQHSELCEEFDYRSAVQKELIRTTLREIVNDEIIFVRCKATKAEHSWPM